MAHLYRVLVYVLSIMGCLTACTLDGSQFSLLQRAEELSRQKKFDAAIEAYREHMQNRLELKERPEWENPYFYLLIIGDIQLGRAQVDEALQTYAEADKKGVDSYLVLDRIRSVARWYAQHHQYREALELLKKYRDRDDILFDAMLDRLAKESVSVEEGAEGRNSK